MIILCSNLYKKGNLSTSIIKKPTNKPNKQNLRGKFDMWEKHKSHHVKFSINGPAVDPETPKE